MFSFPLFPVPLLTHCGSLFPVSLVVLFPPFLNLLCPLSFLFLSFLPLSYAEAHSHLHPRTHPIPPPHSSRLVFLCPLHGFVLWPQCQGPGDEVTLHGRAAGLTKSPPSPPDTRQIVLRSASPSALHFFLSYSFRCLFVQYRSFSSPDTDQYKKVLSFVPFHFNLSPSAFSFHLCQVSPSFTLVPLSTMRFGKC